MKRFVGRSRPGDKPTTSSSSPSPAPPNDSHDPLLEASIAALLPSNYSFEVPKTIASIRKNDAKRVALQMPEGISMYACVLCDLVEQFTDAEAVVLGDVTYGACCVDDFTAKALGCDMLVHYGHSCLVPVDVTSIKTLYIFVEIGIDVDHLVETVRYNFPACLSDKSAQASISIGEHTQDSDDKITRIAIVGTVQFVSALHTLKHHLENNIQTNEQAPTRLALPSTDSAQGSTNSTENDENKSANTNKNKYEIIIPQIKPLSAGEILGCTAPRLDAHVDAILYVGDGRFHLESIMIANPAIPAFRYDPYEKKITHEMYGHDEMKTMRSEAVDAAKSAIDGTWGVILGTLGRQGSLNVLNSITQSFTSTSYVPILMSELSPYKLSLLSEPAPNDKQPKIDIFVQSSCPRLSIDWGYAFPRPLLSPYEASVALGRINKWSNQDGDGYKMDFYADDSSGNWTPRHHIGIALREQARQRAQRKAARDRERTEKQKA